jgi:two-component system, cell cycle sensor histidine kinase and response regulator CckA
MAIEGIGPPGRYFSFFPQVRAFTAELQETMFATPADLSASPEPVSPWATAPASVRDTILIVEDDENIAGLLTCILLRDGYRVLRAKMAGEAQRLFDDHGARIMLALLDCSLPDFNGGVLGGKLRERSHGLPLLFVSGRDLSAARERLAEGGPTGFVPKPFFPTDVLRQVRALIGASV